MNRTRRWFIGGLASCGALGGCRSLRGGWWADDGTPRLRLGVVSDIHVWADAKSEKCAKNCETFRHALEWFRDQGVDAVVIAGDLADDGLTDQMQAVADTWFAVFPDDRAPDGRHVERLFVYGNHDWEGQNYGDAVAKRFPDKEERARHVLRTDYAGNWERIWHEPFAPIWQKEVNGYRFVGAHWIHGYCNGEKEDFNPGILEYYRQHARDFDPAKPFFHIQHPHPKDTCYGSWAWGYDKGDSTQALSRFPNAIAISGHSHYSLTDERSVWQGAFTSVGASSLRYGGLPYDEYEGGYENSSAGGGRGWWYNARKMMGGMNTGNCRQGMLWSVCDDRIVIRRRDFAGDFDLGQDWVLPLPCAESKPFAFAASEKRCRAPEFPADAKLVLKPIRAKNRGGKTKTETVPAVEGPALEVGIPAAIAADGARALCYSVTASVGEVRKTKRVMAEGFNLASADRKSSVPTRCVFSSGELPFGEVRVSVSAENCFHRPGTPLEGLIDWR